MMLWSIITLHLLIDGLYSGGVVVMVGYVCVCVCERERERERERCERYFPHQTVFVGTFWLGNRRNFFT